MWKKIFAFTSLIGILLFFGASFALAQCAVGPTPQVGANCEEYCGDPYDLDAGTGCYTAPAGTLCICNPWTATSVEVLIDNVINFVFYIATVIMPILIIFGAFTFMTSAGEIEKVNRAKSIITYTIIGYVIVLFAKGLMAILAEILGK